MLLEYINSYWKILGGGVLRLIVESILTIEGAVQANGNGGSGRPGCSGGSIWITTKELKGDGSIQV